MCLLEKWAKMNQYFLGTSLHFHSTLAILVPRIDVVVVQFGVENISLLSGRLVLAKNKRNFWNVGKALRRLVFLKQPSNKEGTTVCIIFSFCRSQI